MGVGRPAIFVTTSAGRKSLRQIAKDSGVSPSTVHDRWRKGWDPDRLGDKPESRHKRYETSQGALTAREMADIVGCSMACMWQRLHVGDRGDDLIRPMGAAPKIRASPLPGMATTTDTPWGEITLRELSKRTGIPRTTLRTRYRKGWRGPKLWTQERRHSAKSIRKSRARIDGDTPYELDTECQRFVAEHPDGAQMSEIADAMGVSRQRVAEIADGAMMKLQGRLRLWGMDQHAWEYLGRETPQSQWTQVMESSW